MRTNSLTTLLLVSSAMALPTDAASPSRAEVTAGAQASAGQEVEPLEIRIPVQGLDEHKAPVVERSLRALVDESDPPEKILAEVEVDLEAEHVGLAIVPGKSLSLSQLEKSLAPARGKVRRDRLHIAEARIVVDGRTEEDLSARIKSALSAGRLFESIDVSTGKDENVYLIGVKGGSDKATAAAIAKALQEVSPALKLADVVWSAPEPEQHGRALP